MAIKLLIVCFLCLAVAAGSVRAADNPVVAVETSLGTFKIELYPEKAPITVKNFLAYTDEKFYDGTIFHRVIGKEHGGKDFMIQGGGFLPGLKQKETKDPITNEASNGLANTRGTIAMARTSEPNSATSQFFVNVGDNDFLDQKNAGDKVGYCVFGKVIEGMDVVDKIKAVETKSVGRMGDVPKDDVVIKSIRKVK